jgi:hypothetical protein
LMTSATTAATITIQRTPEWRLRINSVMSHALSLRLPYLPAL